MVCSWRASTSTDGWRSEVFELFAGLGVVAGAIVACAINGDAKDRIFMFLLILAIFVIVGLLGPLVPSA